MEAEKQGLHNYFTEKQVLPMGGPQTVEKLSFLALPLGELSCASMTEGVIEYLQSKYSIFLDF